MQFFIVAIYIGLGLVAISIVSTIVEVLFFQTKWRLKVSREKFVQEIIYFCKPLLLENKIKKYPEFKISYYHHKIVSGYYRDGLIRIYINNNTDVEELINTVLHEIAHHIQMKSNLKEFKRYDEYIHRVGYWRNPMEKEARRFAEKWEEECLNYLVKIGYVIKV